ncbi:MAG: rhodanese-like domain-containing protein [Proteobacteria bacterium]|nr:rhodanese-like domain-containing protein [Pseudomonadota bacterium]
MEHMGQFITNHWELWLALIVVLSLIYINELVSQKKKAKEVSPQAAVGLINNSDAAIIDLRDVENFKNGHIIDAIRATETDFSKPGFEKYKKTPFILVCAKGLQASTIATKLKDQGFNAFVLTGGMTAWQAADLPVVKGK